MLLAQIVGQPAQQAITPVPMQAALPANSAQSLDSEEGSLDGTEMMSFALPLQLREYGIGMGSLAGQTAVLGATSGPIGRSASNPSSQVQLVTEMISAHQQTLDVASLDGDVLQLPVSGNESAQHRPQPSDPALRAIHVPVGNAQWADELGARLTMMTEQGRHAASLRLSPEHLGPLEIRIAIRDDQASVWFGAAHADTRAAIEHALPRLRDMFEAQGMSLADAGVFHEAPHEQPRFASDASSTLAEATSADEPSSVAVRMSVGLVDAYA